tara:strand:+ start:82 stop:585 length:504 start_codon:yes stop_codon:yes gene_type:complete
MKVVDIADEIYRELDSPTDLSIPAIGFWIRSNVGVLNNYISTNFEINSSLEIDSSDSDTLEEIGPKEVAILKKMYYVYDYEKKLRGVLGAASLDAVIQITDLGTSIRKVNKNEVGKTFAQVKKQEMEELHRMIAAYKIAASAPRQVAGDDTEEGYYGDSQISKRTGY